MHVWIYVTYIVTIFNKQMNYHESSLLHTPVIRFDMKLHISGTSVIL